MRKSIFIAASLASTMFLSYTVDATDHSNWSAMYRVQNDEGKMTSVKHTPKWVVLGGSFYSKRLSMSNMTINGVKVKNLYLDVAWPQNKFEQAIESSNLTIVSKEDA